MPQPTVNALIVDQAGNASGIGRIPAAPLHGSSGNVANAIATATLANAAGKTTYITQLQFTFAGATAAGVVIATVAGLLGGTQSFIIAVPAGAAVGGVPLIVSYDAQPVPASAANSVIIVSVPALGAGNLNACLNISGFQL